MPTITNPLRAALALLKLGQDQNAAAVLKAEFDKNREFNFEHARIANMIENGMRDAAIERLSEIQFNISNYVAPIDDFCGGSQAVGRTSAGLY